MFLINYKAKKALYTYKNNRPPTLNKITFNLAAGIMYKKFTVMQS